MSFFQGKPEQLAGFRRGDRAVLADIYRHYVRAIDTFLRRFARAAHRAELCDHAVLGDVLQDTFVRAFSPVARAAYDAERPYLPYLQAIARNVLLDWLRVRRRELLNEEKTCVDVAIAEPLDSFDSLDPLVSSVLGRYLMSLSPELREVYEARYVRGCSQESAAGVLGLSRRKLRTNEDQLRKGLRQALQRAGVVRAEISGMRSLGPALRRAQ